MVVILKEANPDLDKNLFLETISDLKSGIKLKVTRVSDIVESKMNKQDIIFIDFLIDDTLKECKTYNIDADGKKVETTVDASNDIVSIPFNLGKPIETNYKIGKNTNIFSILNHALKLAGKIPQNNKKSFMISIDEIQEVLIDFEFIGIGKYVEDTNFNPYYRLEVASGKGETE